MLWAISRLSALTGHFADHMPGMTGEAQGAFKAAEQPAAVDNAAEHPGTDKTGKPPAVITVLANCTEEGSPQNTLAVIPGPPQQPAAEPSSAPAAGAMDASQRPAAPAPDSAMIEVPSWGLEASQVLRLSETAQIAQQLQQDRVQQEAVPEGWASAAPRTGHAWSAGAGHAQQARLAPEASLSPEQHRQPSSKAAEALGSPGRAVSPALRAPSLCKRMARSRGVRKEGTYIGSGIWLMCYCAKHHHALEQMGASRCASFALLLPAALSPAACEVCRSGIWHACCAVLASGILHEAASCMQFRHVTISPD